MHLFISLLILAGIVAILYVKVRRNAKSTTKVVPQGRPADRIKAIKDREDKG